MTQTDTDPISSSRSPAGALSARASRAFRALAGARPRRPRRGPPRLSVRDDTARLLPVLLPVTLVGAAITVAAGWSFGASDPGTNTVAGLLALLVAASIAEAFPVPIEGVPVGRTSLATVFIVAAAAIYGWAPAVLLAVSTMTIIELGRRKPLSRVTYNGALYALSAAAAGAAAGSVDDPGLTSLALGTLFAACAFYSVNISLLAAVVARSAREPVLRFLRRFLYWTSVPFGIMASLTIILVVLWDRSPFIAVALVGPLVAVALYERWIHGSLTRLRELDRLKDEFMAVVSHELRTPLASVYGAAMTLQRPDLHREGRDAMLGIIYRESARLAQLVDQVLWASRLESGRLEMLIESLDARELAQEVVASAQAHLPPGLSLDLSEDAAPPPVAADAEKLRQVLINLIDNAVKYSPEGGRIDVRLAAANGSVRVTVKDEGLGIPVLEQQRIFDKFNRLDPNLTRGVGGTGLGLYICRELVRQMNGRIWVVSEPGKGSAFTVELPADLSF
jgi:signal transduction histidine kinase